MTATVRLAPPPILSPDPHGIPAGLQQRHQWIVWRLRRLTEGRWTKVPISPHTGELASTTDPSTWGAFETALAMVERGAADGLGFVFAADDPFVGIDLDKVIDPVTGELDADAQRIIADFGTYTELSPSGTGVHLILEGRLPEGVSGRRRGNIEIYQSGRYFTMTGRRLGGASHGE